MWIIPVLLFIWYILFLECDVKLVVYNKTVASSHHYFEIQLETVFYEMIRFSILILGLLTTLLSSKYTYLMYKDNKYLNYIFNWKCSVCETILLLKTFYIKPSWKISSAEVIKSIYFYTDRMTCFVYHVIRLMHEVVTL